MAGMAGGGGLIDVHHDIKKRDSNVTRSRNNGHPILSFNRKTMYSINPTFYITP